MERGGDGGRLERGKISTAMAKGTQSKRPGLEALLLLWDLQWVCSWEDVHTSLCRVEHGTAAHILKPLVQGFRVAAWRRWQLNHSRKHSTGSSGPHTNHLT